MWYGITLILSLFVIFFVGSKVIQWTWETIVTLTSQWLTNFKKWLDLAGWVRLTYKMDFSKYEEIYANDTTQLEYVKRTAQDIFLKNIDKRISTLGVSDYNAYIQQLSDGEYLVVEIGGIQDLEAAKALIGKTVELEFKIPNENTEKDPDAVAARKQWAEEIFATIRKEPSRMEQIATTNGSQDVYYSKYADVTLQELPMIYKSNLDSLLKTPEGEFYPALLSGVYHIMMNAGDGSEQANMQVLEWFTIVRYVGKKQTPVDQPALADVITYTENKWLATEQTVARKTDDASGVYDAQGKKLTYRWDEILAGQEGHNVAIYKLSSGADAQAVMASIEKDNTTTAAEQVAYGWKGQSDITAVVPSFVYDATKKVSLVQELDATYIVHVMDTKKADEHLSSLVKITVASEQAAKEIQTALLIKTTYSFEDIYIADMVHWTAAKDPKSDMVLNGAYFKYASVGQSQTGLPVVSIQFDDTGKGIFCNLTEQYVGKQMAIFVGGKIMTAPVIRDKICGGSAQIDWAFDIDSARTLADDLNSGALPAPLLLSHEETIAPSLGQHALHGSLLAWVVGIVGVYFLMLWMYGWKKATIAITWLIVFLVYLLGIVKLLWVVLSLSGIAAVLLSLGMAVDANVLLYERIKEERLTGKWMQAAITEWYERSWLPIRDGNITTGIIGLLLFLVWVNVFKGFGTMMLINMILILFVVTPLTKYLLRVFYRKEK